MSGIFLSYRREDEPGYVGRLADGLAEAFGDVVFRDVDGILGGRKWQLELQKQVNNAQVLVVVIGRRWQSILSRRDPDRDQVRFELNHARKLKIPVIPVVLQDTQFDYAQDMGDLNWLLELQFLEMSDRQGRWQSDLDLLIESLVGQTNLARLRQSELQVSSQSHQSAHIEQSDGTRRSTQSIFAYLPYYLRDFGAALIGPKQLLALKNSRAEEVYSESLMFILVSFLITFALMASRPFYLQESVWTFVAQQAVIGVFVISLTLAALHIAWRLVGGTASIISVFVTSAYIVGVSSVLMSLVALFAQGFVRVFDPDFYEMIVRSRGDTFMENPPTSRLGGVQFAIVSAGYLIIGFWCLRAWGAFRHLHGLSKRHSRRALLVFSMLFIVALVVAFVIGSAFEPDRFDYRSVRRE